MNTKPTAPLFARLSADTEAYRDASWRRDEQHRIETVTDAERFIEQVGFCNALTDSRTAGASLYIAVCGRRDVRAPRNVQKDREMNAAWHIKDELLKRGRVYYAKLRGARTMFIRRSLVAHFNELYGIHRKDEAHTLSIEAQAILKVLRSEWEMATKDLREEARITDRAKFTRGMDELQRSLKIMPLDVLYAPRFTYIWTLAEARFRDELKTKLARDEALTEIARVFLKSAGTTLRGELARVTGLSRRDAGIANHNLVTTGEAERLALGVYRWSKDSAT